MNNKVMILLSTYNGMKYLYEQIECIYNQDYSGEIEILVRDDGSKDDTVKTLKNYPQQTNRKITVVADKNCGPQRSFLKLIKMAEGAGYYFFADQDDVWDLDKVSRAVGMLEKEDAPAIYCGNYRHTDGDLKLLDEKVIKTKPRFTPIKMLLYNQIPGCCMGLNEKLMALLRAINIDNVMMHDSMALSLACYCGKVIFDERPTINHRIHGSNVVGEGHKKIIPHKWIVEKFKLLVHREDYDISKLAEEFIRVSPKGNSDKLLRDVELLRDYKKSFGNRIKLLKHNDAKDKPFDRTTMSIRCKIFFALF